MGRGSGKEDEDVFTTGKTISVPNCFHWVLSKNHCFDSSRKVLLPNLTNRTPVVDTVPFMLVATHWK